MVNGGGRAEVQAAHINPVAAGGLDTVQNDIALSGTVHWLFDRYLIAITGDYRLSVAHNRIPTELVNLFRPSAEVLLLPNDSRLWPSRAFWRTTDGATQTRLRNNRGLGDLSFS